MTPVELAARTYVWGLPLVAVHRTRARAGDGMVARTGLATAADRTVVGPNNDTLYASGFFDLADGDLLVEIGELDPRRYWSVMLLDAYTNVTYVCRRLHGSGGATVRVTLDPMAGPVRGAPPVVALGTRTVWVLVRVVVDGPDDLGAARAALGTVAVAQARPAAPQVATAARVARRPRRDRAPGAPGFFADLRAALAVDPPVPWQPAPPPGADVLLDVGPATVLAEGAALAERRLVARGGGADHHRNGWGTRTRGADFGDDVEYRAAFARVSLAGHLPVENRSYTRPVDGTRPARLRFGPGQEPPVTGFWSLTVYGPDLFLVGNAIDRHSVGDRTPGLRRDPDGGVSVVVAHERPDVAANWLPGPAGPGYLVLRCYEGAPALVAATWFPPPLEPLGTS